MKVNDLNETQRSALDELTADLLCTGVMMGLDHSFRNDLQNAAVALAGTNCSAADVIRRAMGDFHVKSSDIKPGPINDFLNTLVNHDES